MKFAKISLKILVLTSTIMFASCRSTQNINYFSNLKHEYEQSRPIENNIETRVKPDDQLNIKVMSTNVETNGLLNNNLAQAAEGAFSGYLVDKEGYINFPLIGKIKVSGLTTNEVAEKLTKYISDNYVKNPIVNVTISNFKITIIGKVGVPRSIVVPNAKINIIEALGQAGDIVDVGDKENVLIIRESEGTRSTARINLTNKESFNSPYFYLQQNDIIYVQASEKALLNKNRVTFSIISSGIALISSLTLIITRLRL